MNKLFGLINIILVLPTTNAGRGSAGMSAIVSEEESQADSLQRAKGSVGSIAFPLSQDSMLQPGEREVLCVSDEDWWKDLEDILQWVGQQHNKTPGAVSIPFCRDYWPKPTEYGLDEDYQDKEGDIKGILQSVKEKVKREQQALRPYREITGQSKPCLEEIVGDISGWLPVLDSESAEKAFERDVELARNQEKLAEIFGWRATEVADNEAAEERTGIVDSVTGSSGSAFRPISNQRDTGP